MIKSKQLLLILRTKNFLLKNSLNKYVATLKLVANFTVKLFYSLDKRVLNILKLAYH